MAGCDRMDDDAALADRLARLQHRDGPDSWVFAAPTFGQDESGSLELTVDCTRRVVGVYLHALPGWLRVPAALETAVAQAYLVADMARITAVAASSPRAQEYRELGEAAMSGRYRITVPSAPDVTSPPPNSTGSPSAATVAALTAAPGPTGRRPRVGGSRHGEVGVDFDTVDRPVRIRADPDWLAAAEADDVAEALVDALTLPVEAA